MAKKIYLSLCSGIAAIGLVILIVGFAFGGTMGSFNARNGEFVYDSWDGSTYKIANAPRWFGYNFNLFGYSPNTTHSYTVGNEGVSGRGSTTIPLPGTVSYADIYAASCYVNISYGEDARIEIDGNMPYTYTLNAGVLGFYTHDSSITTAMVNGLTRYYMNGEDVTTTINITLPRSLQTLDVNLDVGDLSISGLVLDNLFVNANVANINVVETTASYTDYALNVSTLRTDNVLDRTITIGGTVSDVSYNGNITEVLYLEVAVGTVEVNVPRPANYGYWVEGVVSNIRIDGQRVTNFFEGEAYYNNGAEVMFFVESEAATDVSINFT